MNQSQGKFRAVMLSQQKPRLPKHKEAQDLVMIQPSSLFEHSGLQAGSGRKPSVEQRWRDEFEWGFCFRDVLYIRASRTPTVL